MTKICTCFLIRVHSNPLDHDGNLCSGLEHSTTRFQKCILKWRIQGRSLCRTTTRIRRRRTISCFQENPIRFETVSLWMSCSPILQTGISWPWLQQFRSHCFYQQIQNPDYCCLFWQTRNLLLRQEGRWASCSAPSESVTDDRSRSNKLDSSN